MATKQLLLKVGLTLCCLLQAACASHSSTFVQSQVQNNLLDEHWQSQVDTSPSKWHKHADNWLWFGEANSIEQSDRTAPYSAAMSTMMVRVPDFTRVHIDGDFQVQFDGRFQHNSVYLLGPNEEIRQIVVEVKDHSLNLHLAGTADPKHVIVRIAIHNLQEITQNGSGKVEGRFIKANPLVINSYGSGDMILAGKINVRHITQSGTGDITLLGAYAPSLKIDSLGKGTLNISGRVGVEVINHSGSGDINILGADTNNLSIWASGSGKIGIKGIANVKQISAAGTVGIYIYRVRSTNVYIYLKDRAQLGLAGATKSLYVDARNSSSFQGSYLHSEYTYVRAREYAHVNSAGDDRVFAAADDNSSIYVIGRPSIISPYVNGNAVVIPIEPPPATPQQELRAAKRRAGRFGTETYLP